MDPKRGGDLGENDGRGKVHPRDAKMRLAYEVTDTFYGKEQATQAQNDFIQRFRRKRFGHYSRFCHHAWPNIVDAFGRSDRPSKSQAKRLFEQGVTMDGEPLKIGRRSSCLLAGRKKKF